MIPWHLYNLTPRDQAGARIRPYHEHTLTVVTAGTGSAQQSFIPPREHYLLVTQISVVAFSLGADAAEAVGYDLIDTDAPGTTHNWIRSFREANTGFQSKLGRQWQSSPLLLVNDRQTLRTYGEMLTTAANWHLRSSVSGILIPAGNIALT